LKPGALSEQLLTQSIQCFKIAFLKQLAHLCP
jgi:hypothetical protein